MTDVKPDIEDGYSGYFIVESSGDVPRFDSVKELEESFPNSF